MEPLQLHSIQTEEVYQHDGMSIQSFDQSDVFCFEGMGYTNPKQLVQVRNHRILRVCRMIGGQRQESLFAIDGKLAEMLLVLKSEELLIEAKQEFHTELQEEVRKHLFEAINCNKKNTYLRGEILKLERVGFWRRVSWVFKGFPKIDIFGY